MSIPPTALIDPGAKIHPLQDRPYCVIGPDVELGEGCELFSHVRSRARRKNRRPQRLVPFSSVGLAPRHQLRGEPTRLEIGDHNRIASFVTINGALPKAAA